jgi:polyhydroxybutyrate depolymerase
VTLWRALLGVAVVPVVGACGGGSSEGLAPDDVQRGQDAGCLAAGTHVVDGATLTMPADPQVGHVRLLVVVIPGPNGDPRDRLGLRRAARRAGVATVYPVTSDGFWELNHRHGDGDVRAVRTLLDDLATGCFRDVSVTGVSNGAGFAARLGCELPHRFAAVMPVAAGYRALDPCPATARASFLAIHGTADTVVPFNGRRDDGRKGNVPRATARWGRRDGCARRPRVTHPRPLVTRYAYRDCDGDRHVVLLRLTGTDHGWPGAGPPLPDHNPSGLRATDEILRFLRAIG